MFQVASSSIFIHFRKGEGEGEGEREREGDFDFLLPLFSYSSFIFTSLGLV